MPSFFDILKGYTAILPYMLIGYLVVSLLIAKEHILSIPVKLALSTGLGLGVLSFSLFILSICGSSFNGLYIWIALILSIFALTYFNKQNFITTKLPHSHKDIYFYITVLFLLTSFLYLTWKSMFLPVYTYDAISSSAFKAKIFFFNRGLVPLNNLPHPSYPLLIPLSQTWIALTMNTWNDQVIKILFPVIFISFSIINYDFVKKRTNSLWSLLLLSFFIFSCFPMYHATIAYRDIPVMYFNCTAILLLVTYLKTKKNSLLILAGIFSGLMSFTKLEGSLYLLTHTLILIFILMQQKDLIKNKLKSFLAFSVPSFSICIFFHIYKLVNHIVPEKIFIDFSLKSLERIPMIISGFFYDMFLTGNWNILWFMLIISIVANMKKIKKNKEIQTLLFALSLFFGFYFFNGLFTQNYEWLGGPGTKTTLSRLILHFYPLALTLVCLLNYEDSAK